MALKIDPEFRDLIPPLTEEEYKGLEENILLNGFNPAFPIIVWKGQEIIVDGHNRHSICIAHSIPSRQLSRNFLQGPLQLCGFLIISLRGGI